MFYFNIILFFIIGLAIGSFLNVLILRIDHLKTVWFERSHCPKCKKILSWLDLIPIVSFVVLKGECRYCKAKISWQYPLVEFFTGISFALLFLAFGMTAALFFYLIMLSLLIVVLVHDLKSQMVPEAFVWVALILAFVGGWYFGNFGFLNMIYGGLIGGGVLALLVLVSKEKWMGAGDIKIGAILGLLVGFPVAIFGMFFAFLTGAVIGLIYIFLFKKTLKDALPFAPFLILATFVSLIFGQAIIGWYLGTYFW